MSSGVTMMESLRSFAAHYVFIAIVTASGVITADNVSPPLTFTVEPPSQTVVLYQPAEFELKLTNAGRSDLELMGGIGPPEYCLRDFESPESPGHWQPWDDRLRFGCSTRLIPIQLPAGKSLTQTIEIGWRLQLPLFERAGRYRLRFQCPDYDVGIVECLVLVTEGTVEDVQCREELLDAGLQNLLTLDAKAVLGEDIGSGHRPNWTADLHRLYEIARDHPDSSYSDYCLSALIAQTLYLWRGNYPRSLPEPLHEEFMSLAKRRVAEQPTGYCRTAFRLGQSTVYTDKENASHYLLEAQRRASTPATREGIRFWLGKTLPPAPVPPISELERWLRQQGIRECNQ
jgi:hypothetical protein